MLCNLFQLSFNLHYGVLQIAPSETPNSSPHNRFVKQGEVSELSSEPNDCKQLLTSYSTFDIDVKRYIQKTELTFQVIFSKWG